MAVVAFNHLKSLALKVKAEIAEVANAAADALEELEAQKPDKAQEVSATIPVTGWSADTNAYPNYYDLTAAGVTEHDEARVNPDPASVAVMVADLRDAGRENPIPCLAGPGQCHLCEVSDSARKGVSLWATMEV